MATFGKTSLEQIATLDPRLQRILHEAIRFVDFKVLEGHRGEAAQEAAYAKGLTKLHWPHGNHNKLPSRAADHCPDLDEVFRILAALDFLASQP